MEFLKNKHYIYKELVREYFRLAQRASASGATVVGGGLNFTTHPAAQIAGKVIGVIGIAALGASSTTETNPEKIKIKIK